MTDIKQNRPMERPRPGRHPSRNPSSLHSSKDWNQKPSGSGPPTPNRTSVNRLKSKIRDLTRLLRHSENLPADVQVVQERALAGYRQALEQIESEKRKSQMISKYHMVRFFERQKATRHLKQVRKRLAALAIDSPEHPALREELETATIDLDYTMYHPLDVKYQSLYPPPPKEEPAGKGGDADRGRKVHSKRNRALKPKLWDVVAQCRESGQLEALRDGKLRKSTTKAVEESIGSESARAKVQRKKASHQMEEEELGEESDGGFFEE